MTDKITVAGINPKEALAGAELTSGLKEALNLLDTAVETIKDVQKAKALIADAQAMVDVGLAALKSVETLFDLVIDAILQTFDISYHYLTLFPEEGGLYAYHKRYKTNLFDQADANRPYDEGGAFLINVSMIVNFTDPTTAIDNFNKFVKLFENTDNARKKALQKLLGAVDFDDLRTAFWGHYKKKELAGTHQANTNNWGKKSISDMFPETYGEVVDFFDTMKRKIVPNIEINLLSLKIDAMFNDILGVIRDLSKFVTSWESLLLDSQILFIVTPAIGGTIEDDTIVTSATKNLGRYLSTIYDQIKLGTYNDIFNSGFDLTPVLNPSQNVGGIEIVFKASTPDLVIQQTNAFLTFFGLGSIDFSLVDSINDVS